MADSPSLRRREEVPISGKSFAHRCVGDIIRRKSEEFELQPDRAVGERRGRDCGRARRAQIIPFDMNLKHSVSNTSIHAHGSALARMRQQENQAAHDKGGATDDQRQTERIHPAGPEVV
jgi:hypothetical protein